MLKALKKGGVKVPQEAAVITFDNYPIAEYMDPPLTVIDVDTYKLGEMAASVLIEKIKSHSAENEHVLIDTKLIVRASTEGGQ